MKQVIFVAVILANFSLVAHGECTSKSILQTKQLVRDLLTVAVADRTDGCNRLTLSSPTLAKDVYDCDKALTGPVVAKASPNKLISARNALAKLKHCVGQVATGYVPEPCKLARGINVTPATDTLSKNIDACVLAVKNFPADSGVNATALIAALRAAQPCQGKFDMTCSDQVIEVRESLVEAYSKVKPTKALPKPPVKQK